MHWVFLDGCSVSGPKGTADLPHGGLCTLSAILVLNHGHPVPRERLEEILWEGARPDRARDRLNTMLWRLRKIVTSVGGRADAIQNKRDFLIYAAATASAVPKSDLAEIGRLTRRVTRDGITSPEEAEQCLARVQACHTDFLPHAGDHWSMITRESLRSGLLMIIEALIGYMRDQGRWGRVTELAERMLALDPTLELGHRQLIEMHGQRRDLRSAQRHYDVMEKVLRDSLDVDPAPETAAAIDALRIARRQDPPDARADGPPRSSVRPIPTRRPTLQSVQQALDHLDAARDTLTR